MALVFLIVLPVTLQFLPVPGRDRSPEGGTAPRVDRVEVPKERIRFDDGHADTIVQLRPRLESLVDDPVAFARAIEEVVAGGSWRAF